MQHHHRSVGLAGLAHELFLNRAARQREAEQARTLPVEEFQILAEEIATVRQHRLPGLRIHQTRRNLLGNAVGHAPDPVVQAFRLERRVQAQHEDLIFIDAFVAFPRLGREDRGAAGVESERLCIDRHAIESLDTRLERKAATYPGRQVALEVIRPVPAVHPAAAAFFLAVDIEWFGQPGVAQRHHLVGEADRDLAYAFDFTLWRKGLDAGGMDQADHCQPKQ